MVVSTRSVLPASLSSPAPPTLPFAAIGNDGTPRSCSWLLSLNATCSPTCTLPPAPASCVTAYADTPSGTMIENNDGSGEFTEVVLRPVVTVADASMRERATALHDDAEKLCFIARSVNFPVHHRPVAVSDSPAPLGSSSSAGQF